MIWQQDAGLDEDLKSVTDSQDEFLGRLERLERLLQVMPDLVSENSPCRDVIPVAESTGQTQHLVISGQLGVFQQTIDMNQLRASAGLLEGKRRFAVAVRSRSTQD